MKAILLIAIGVIVLMGASVIIVASFFISGQKWWYCPKCHTYHNESGTMRCFRYHYRGRMEGDKICEECKHSTKS